MKKIYSLENIGWDKIRNETIIIANTEGKENLFSICYRIDEVVNMPYLGSESSGANSQGWKRNSKYFFKEQLKRNPELFSEKNVQKINQGQAPICDAILVKYHEEYLPYLGDKLIHHHIGQDGQCVMLPQSCHGGFGGVHTLEKTLGITEYCKLFSEKTNDLYGNKPQLFLWTQEQIEEILKEVVPADKLGFPENQSKNEDMDKILSKEGTIDEKNIELLNMKSVRKEVQSNIIQKIASHVVQYAKTHKTKIIVGVSVAVALIFHERKNNSLNSNNAYTQDDSQSDEDEMKENKGMPNADDEVIESVSGSPKSPHYRRPHLRTLKDGTTTEVKGSNVNGDK